MDMIQDLIASTAWRMEIPRAYGWLHLLVVLLGFPAAGILAWKLRSLSWQKSCRLLLGTGLFLAVSEVYKQLLYCLVLYPGSYHYSAFPFHLCSMPMYLCIISAILPQGRLRRSILSFMMLYNFLGGAIAFAEPSGLLHGYVTLTAHSLLWHLILVFLGFYLFFSGLGGSTVADYRDATIVLFVLSAAAFGINLLLRKPSNGTINMFFVGPTDSSLIVFQSISHIFGWYVCTPVYLLCLCLGGYILRLGAARVRQNSTILTAHCK